MDNGRAQLSVTKKAETRLQQRIRKELIKAVGGKWIKIHGSSFQEAGQPDIIGCVEGQMYGFEVKLPFVGRPSALQLETLDEWRQEGAIACIVETPAQAIALVKAAQASPNKRRRGRKLYKWICATLRAADGEDMGYGRHTRSGARRNIRRTPKWAQNQLKVNMGKVFLREAPVLSCVP